MGSVLSLPVATYALKRCWPVADSCFGKVIQKRQYFAVLQIEIQERIGRAKSRISEFLLEGLRVQLTIGLS
jgi:hypothetical protein